MKATVYKELIDELKRKENGGHKDKILEVKKGKVGFEMGLKVAIDSHSNKASPATVNSDGNAFQVTFPQFSAAPHRLSTGVYRQP
jgi:hypothetical protein